MEQVQKHRDIVISRAALRQRDSASDVQPFVVSYSHQTLRYCPCCAIHVCDSCYSFPAGTTTATKSCFFHFHLLLRFFFSSDKLKNSPINLRVPETQQSADTALGWRGSLAVVVSAVSLQACHRLQPLCSAQADSQIAMVQEFSSFMWDRRSKLGLAVGFQLFS